jgi:hypothetical protein
MHINYRRGESRTLVVRREHVSLVTKATVNKGKGNTWKRFKRESWRVRRQQIRQAIKNSLEMPVWKRNIK